MVAAARCLILKVVVVVAQCRVQKVAAGMVVVMMLEGVVKQVIGNF